jgi:pimeloyl-ACP methyl ester carboxylesterase
MTTVFKGRQFRWQGFLLVLFVASWFAGAVHAQGQHGPLPKAPADVKPGSIDLEDVDYPYPVSYLPLTMYGQDVRMAYMDVAPLGAPNGRTVVMFHGMEWGGFYFGGVIDVLRKAGFRVVVPDQVGWGRSSKPIMPYNFHDMALNTRTLLQSLGVAKAVIFGHSMGGMLAARFAASYPDMTELVVLCNPIGVTDGRWQKDAHWESAEQAYKRKLALTHDQLYQQSEDNIRIYFPNAWKPEYEKYARILYAQKLGGDWPRLAMVQAIFEQITYLDPVVYDWPHIQAKTLLLCGAADILVGPDYPKQLRHIAEAIPHSQLVLIPNVGHVPFVQAPDVFYPDLMKFLK